MWHGIQAAIKPLLLSELRKRAASKGTKAATRHTDESGIRTFLLFSRNTSSDGSHGRSGASGISVYPYPAYPVGAVAAFPLAKLGFILVRQISRPIANGIANKARKNKIFRDYICLPVAQFFHWCDVKIRMRVLNLGKVTQVPKLNE